MLDHKARSPDSHQVHSPALPQCLARKVKSPVLLAQVHRVHSPGFRLPLELLLELRPATYHSLAINQSLALKVHFLGSLGFQPVPGGHSLVLPLVVFLKVQSLALHFPLAPKVPSLQRHLGLVPRVLEPVLESVLELVERLVLL